MEIGFSERARERALRASKGWVGEAEREEGIERREGGREWGGRMGNCHGLGRAAITRAVTAQLLHVSCHCACDGPARRPAVALTAMMRSAARDWKMDES